MRTPWMSRLRPAFRRGVRPRRTWALVAAGGVAAAAVAAGVLLGRGWIDAPGRSATAPGAADAGKRLPAGFARHRDDLTGASLAYPVAWQPLRSRDRDVRLVASDGRGGSLLLRAVDVGSAVGTADLTALRRYTDRAVVADKDVRLIAEPRRVKLGGLPGWHYLYTFEGRGADRRGAHSHFLVFRGRTMFALVFQALPTTEFRRLAPVFDAIAASFRARA